MQGIYYPSKEIGTTNANGIISRMETIRRGRHAVKLVFQTNEPITPALINAGFEVTQEPDESNENTTIATLGLTIGVARITIRHLVISIARKGGKSIGIGSLGSQRRGVKLQSEYRLRRGIEVSDYLERILEAGGIPRIIIVTTQAQISGHSFAQYGLAVEDEPDKPIRLTLSLKEDCKAIKKGETFWGLLNRILDSGGEVIVRNIAAKDEGKGDEAGAEPQLPEALLAEVQRILNEGGEPRITVKGKKPLDDLMDLFKRAGFSGTITDDSSPPRPPANFELIAMVYDPPINTQSGGALARALDMALKLGTVTIQNKPLRKPFGQA